MSEKNIWNILKKNKKYVGPLLAEEDRKYRLQKIDEEMKRLKSQQATLQSTQIDPIKTKIAFSKLQWSPTFQKRVLQKLKQDPKAAPKKSIVSYIESIVDSFL